MTVPDRAIVTAVLNWPGITRVLWWTYWSGGHFTRSRIEVKLSPLRQAPSGVGSALLAASTPLDVDSGEARARLRRAVGARGANTVRLDELGRS